VPTIRSSLEAVARICVVDEDTYDEATFEAAFLEPASWLVQDVCEPAYDPAASEAKLEIIERYLAAHFYSVTDPVSISEWIGSVRTFYEYKVDLHLNVTRFGQQAMLLDTSGALAAHNNAMKKALATLPADVRPVTAFWLGETLEQP